MRLVLWIVGAGIAACSAAGVGGGEYGDDPEDASMPTPTPEVEAGPDVGPTELDASACTDCEYFPETCSADVLCPNGPFDANSSESLDVRTSIESIRGRSSKDVWVVGALGAIAHFDGVVWKRSDAETQDTLMNLWLRESSEVALGGFGQVYARGVEIVDGGASPSIDGWAPYSPTYVAGQKLTDARVVGVWAAPGSEWLWCASQTSSTSTTTSATAGLWRLRHERMPAERVHADDERSWGVRRRALGRRNRGKHRSRERCRVRFPERQGIQQPDIECAERRLECIRVRSLGGRCSRNHPPLHRGSCALGHRFERSDERRPQRRLGNVTVRRLGGR